MYARCPKHAPADMTKRLLLIASALFFAFIGAIAWAFCRPPTVTLTFLRYRDDQRRAARRLRPRKPRLGGSNTRRPSGQSRHLLPRGTRRWNFRRCRAEKQTRMSCRNSAGKALRVLGPVALRDSPARRKATFPGGNQRLRLVTRRSGQALPKRRRPVPIHTFSQRGDRVD